MAFNPHYSIQLPGYWQMLFYAFLFIIIMVGGPYLLAWILEAIYGG